MRSGCQVHMYPSASRHKALTTLPVLTYTHSPLAPLTASQKPQWAEITDLEDTGHEMDMGNSRVDFIPRSGLWSRTRSRETAADNWSTPNLKRPPELLRHTALKNAGEQIQCVLNMTFLLNCHSTGLSLVLFRAVTVLEWSRSLQDPFLDMAW
ncbi:hypothetical protein QQF64_005632 [Cirrhinus molitorella]|uniref:Uncharacterized protein n=1 Tax=Cirrhinus molitorella TaxID=172907 RepID=A0ABR3MGS6_9TELE